MVKVVGSYVGILNFEVCMVGGSCYFVKWCYEDVLVEIRGEVVF